MLRFIALQLLSRHRSKPTRYLFRPRFYDERYIARLRRVSGTLIKLEGRAIPLAHSLFGRVIDEARLRGWEQRLQEAVQEGREVGTALAYIVAGIPLGGR